jgi:hypothetical protein
MSRSFLVASLPLIIHVRQTLVLSAAVIEVLPVHFAKLGSLESISVVSFALILVGLCRLADHGYVHRS